jgi:hypothetical protein
MNFFQAVSAAKAQSAVPSIVTSGLILQYDFSNTSCYSGSGTSVNDLQSTYDTTLYNGVGFTSSDGGALQFDGTDDYGLVDMDDVYTHMGEFTISYWIKHTMTGYGTVFGLASGDTGASNYYSEALSLLLNNNGTSAQSGYTRLFLRDEGPWGNGGGLNTMIAGFPCGSNDGNWHNVSISYINSSTPVLTAYVDGVSKTVSYRSGSRDQINLSYVNNPSERKPALGAGHGRDDTVGTFLDGDMGAFFFYDKVLSSTEVTQNYNATKSRFGL